VQGTGDQLFASPGFAQDQYVRPVARDLVDAAEYAPDGVRPPYQPHQAGLQRRGRALDRRLRQYRSCPIKPLVWLDRERDVVGTAVLHGIDGILDGV
jgi:hypothetical protein